MSANQDPLKKDRENGGLHIAQIDGESIPLILKLKEIRKTAKDWQTYSSDNPLMCVLHSEAHVRTVRQLPLEIDPPQHTTYRALVEPMFKRPKTDPAYAVKIEHLINQALDCWFKDSEPEAVRGLALPIQCHALAVLLQMPVSAAHEWISWGVHVFHDRDDGNDAGPVLEAYTKKQFERAETNPGNDFFSVLNAAQFQGRALSMEEKQG
jgi:cytochrome P450|tara:strand:- start:225 stop:851 length:627 start_codon:yes stop_codon:yes gene_type:complete